MFGLMMSEDRISLQARRREIIHGLRLLPGTSRATLSLTFTPEGCSRHFLPDPVGDAVFLKDFIYLILEREEGREKEKVRERNISVWLPLVRPSVGTWPATQACALAGNRTGDLFGLWDNAQLSHAGTVSPNSSFALSCLSPSERYGVCCTESQAPRGNVVPVTIHSLSHSLRALTWT